MCGGGGGSYVFRPPPSVVRGVTSPDVLTSVTPTTTDQLTGLPNVVSSSLSVTPQALGRHTVCVEVLDSTGYVVILCYGRDVG
jgi:hypothetical protein